MHLKRHHAGLAEPSCPQLSAAPGRNSERLSTLSCHLHANCSPPRKSARPVMAGPSCVRAGWRLIPRRAMSSRGSAYVVSERTYQTRNVQIPVRKGSGRL